ncbi:MAG TPA: hypothetical protein VIW24_28085 [Aldersonia sp.]
MTDHSDNLLRAVVKSLRDVVAPAVDTADPMAQQQLALSLNALEFVRSRLGDLHAREVFELEHHVNMGRRVQAELGAETERLDGALTVGEKVLADPRARDLSLRRATAAIASAIRDLVASPLDDAIRRRVDLAILESTEARVAFERAWYQPMGFDPDAATIGSVQAAMSAN